MMEDENVTDTTPNAERAVRLIQQKIAVRWPAGHVELALISLQRRRQQRRVAIAGATLGVGSLALLLALVPELPRTVATNLSSSLRSEKPAATSASAPSSTLVPLVRAVPPPAAVPAPVAAAPKAPAAAPAPAGHILQQRLVPRRQVAAARWVALAGQKRFGEAYGLLRQVPIGSLSEPDDLMLAADVARQAGRPERAVAFLQRVVDEHPRELCAQLAGFSLGKVYLDSLDEPTLAARRFAAVRAMAPSGGLAQDALAREVEAWARAGASDRARAAATEYARLYPTGRRLAAVRDLGGI
jgi:transmembrane sensor